MRYRARVSVGLMRSYESAPLNLIVTLSPDERDLQLYAIITIPFLDIYISCDKLYRGHIQVCVSAQNP